METDYLIIGGGPAGIAAAQAIRENDSEGRVLVVDQEGHCLYSKIIFHHFLSGKISKDKLFLRSEQFYEKYKIELTKGRVVEGRYDEKRVKLESGQQIEFDKLIIASGGQPRRLEVQGAQDAFLSFYSLQDAVNLKDKVQNAQKVLVVGGGFLTLDLLDGLAELGKKIVLIMRDDYLLQNRLGEAGGKILQKSLQKAGVKIIANAQVEKISSEKAVRTAILDNGERVDFDLGVSAIGLKIDLDFAKSLGLAIDKGIVTDKRMRSSLEDVYACGDVCQFEDPFSHEWSLPGNYLFAQESGKIAGLNASGGDVLSQTYTMVSKKVLSCQLFFCGSADKKYQMSDMASGERYAAIFEKEGKVVGISTLNLLQKTKIARQSLGTKIKTDDLLKELLS
ncbi:MAG: NADH-rubredoxin oxidoreductase [candidate division WS2 bacterium ADurb.Bin280]|uniref:NADH-rubredoxin oxidoreductase n=1 Tax=candidate division WS2 bacterium ADurb.Bin280 TaxID=1852829 RepID=A0A1V5SDA1_9BACT|nr:MAG: NADH-rubredoxin oxidoreductase [candidate division WS2 bacterium ADurb.Bin280]